MATSSDSNYKRELQWGLPDGTSKPMSQVTQEEIDANDKAVEFDIWRKQVTREAFEKFFGKKEEGENQMKTVCAECGHEQDNMGPCGECGGPRVVVLSVIESLFGSNWKKSFAKKEEGENQ